MIRWQHAAIAALCVLLPGPISCVAPPDPAPGLRVRSARPGTEVVITVEGGRSVADIRCPSGIGWAEFALAGDVVPGAVVFRLHVRGLEGLRIQCGGELTHIAVSSHGDSTVRQWQAPDVALPESERIPVALVPAEGAPRSIPLDGWFEIGLPQGCSGGGIVWLEWVDFYR